MVFGNRLIDIRSFWKPTIRIVKIGIRFSTSINSVIYCNSKLITVDIGIFYYHDHIFDSFISSCKPTCLLSRLLGIITYTLLY